MNSPSFAALYDDLEEQFYGNYASLWTAGANLSYGFFGVGIESRFGNITYKPLGSDSEEDNENVKTSLSGFRAYITFKF